MRRRHRDASVWQMKHINIGQVKKKQMDNRRKHGWKWHEKNKLLDRNDWRSQGSKKRPMWGHNHPHRRLRFAKAEKIQNSPVHADRAIIQPHKRLCGLCARIIHITVYTVKGLMGFDWLNDARPYPKTPNIKKNPRSIFSTKPDRVFVPLYSRSKLIRFEHCSEQEASGDLLGWFSGSGELPDEFSDGNDISGKFFRSFFFFYSKFASFFGFNDFFVWFFSFLH